MKIVKAVYGRTEDGESVCEEPADPTRTENTDCRSDNSMKVKRICFMFIRLI